MTANAYRILVAEISWKVKTWKTKKEASSDISIREVGLRMGDGWKCLRIMSSGTICVAITVDFIGVV